MISAGQSHQSRVPAFCEKFIKASCRVYHLKTTVAAAAAAAAIWMLRVRLPTTVTDHTLLALSTETTRAPIQHSC